MSTKQTQANGCNNASRSRTRLWSILFSAVLCAAVSGIVGCGSSGEKKKNEEFFTSGSKEADQRASQRMAKAEQLSGSGEGAGDKEKKGKSEKETKQGEGQTEKAPAKRTLYDRLGGDQGITKIVDDFLSRAMQDPRVNWNRKGVKQGGFSLHRNDTVEWKASPDNVAKMKKHMAQFFALATGGPAHYEGKDMGSAHANLHITNAEFDAAVGDLKATLDKFQIANEEQKELLAIVESTRPQIATQR